MALVPEEESVNCLGGPGEGRWQSTSRAGSSTTRQYGILGAPDVTSMLGAWTYQRIKEPQRSSALLISITAPLRRIAWIGNGRRRLLWGFVSHRQLTGIQH